MNCDYTEQGLTMDRPILVDGRAGKLLSVSADGLGTTSVTFSDDLPPVDLLAAEIRVASPGAAGNRLLFSNVSGTAGSPTNTLLFSDPGEAIFDILDAGGGFTVLPFYEDYWGGTWDTVSYNGVSGRTELTGSFGLEMVSLGETVHVGDIVVANLLQPVPLHIEVLDINNPGDDTLEVEGDITAFVSAGDRFRIHQQSPYKYDFSDELKGGPCDWGARYTWSGYRRMPWTWSRAGEDPYHTWNRWYLSGIGRWASTDAAMSPWGNLQVCTDNNPLILRDQSGLSVKVTTLTADGQPLRVTRSGTCKMNFEVDTTGEECDCEWRQNLYSYAFHISMQAIADSHSNPLALLSAFTPIKNMMHTTTSNAGKPRSFWGRVYADNNQENEGRYSPQYKIGKTHGMHDEPEYRKGWDIYDDAIVSSPKIPRRGDVIHIQTHFTSYYICKDKDGNEQVKAKITWKLYYSVRPYSHPDQPNVARLADVQKCDIAGINKDFIYEPTHKKAHDQHEAGDYSGVPVGE